MRHISHSVLCAACLLSDAVSSSYRTGDRISKCLCTWSSWCLMLHVLQVAATFASVAVVARRLPGSHGTSRNACPLTQSAQPLLRDDSECGCQRDQFEVKQAHRQAKLGLERILNHFAYLCPKSWVWPSINTAMNMLLSGQATCARELCDQAECADLNEHIVSYC